MPQLRLLQCAEPADCAHPRQDGICGCELCEQEYWLNPTTSQCERCARIVPNCVYYQRNTCGCAACGDGYAMKSALECVKCSKGCQYFNTNTCFCYEEDWQFSYFYYNDYEFYGLL